MQTKSVSTGTDFTLYQPKPATDYSVISVTTSARTEYRSLLPRRLISPGWIIKQPLPIVVEHGDDGMFLVGEELFGQYGLGKTYGEAWKAFIANLIDYYQFVSSRATPDDPAKQNWLEHVQQFIAPTGS